MKIAAIIFVVACALLTVHARHTESLLRQGGNDFEEKDYETRWNFLRQQTQDWDSSVPASWHNDMKNDADAAQLLRKIKNRLNESSALSRREEAKEKIKELARVKLYKCKAHSGPGLDSACVGRLTGQMMQLIAAIENVTRDMPGMTAHSSF